MTSHIQREIASTSTERRRTAALAFTELLDADVALLPQRGSRIDSLVLLVTDLMGFTPLVERLGDLRARQLIREHNRLIRGCLHKHRGIEVVHTGDGILACFLVPQDAVECALAIQAALADRNLAAGGPPLHVRVGIHCGSALVEENRLFGAAVVAAVRICDHCQPGRILVSRTVRAALPELTRCFQSCGSQVLKGFTEPMELFLVSASIALEARQ